MCTLQYFRCAVFSKCFKLIIGLLKGKEPDMQRFCSPKSMCRTRTVTDRTECKIKAHGANEGLSPCLHIDFYGSPPECIAPSSERRLNEGYRIGWFHSEELACFPPDQPE